MSIYLRKSHPSAGAAISLAAAFVIGTNATAQVPAPLRVGPDRVGSAVTYRLTASGGRGESAPTVQTLALNWKLGAKVAVMLKNADGTQAMPYVATRAADGTLTLDNPAANDADGERIAIAIGVLNRLAGIVAAAPAGATTWKTTLVVQTLAPQPLKIPVAATRGDDATGTTFAASGSVDRALARPPGGGSPRGGGGMGGRGMGGGRMGGGGMGGGRMGDSSGSDSGPRSTKVTTKITVDAHFGRDGALTSSTIVEANQSAADQSQPPTRSWQIERMPQGNGAAQPTARAQLQQIHSPQSIDQELARLTKDLELTAEQQQYVRPILQEHHDRIQALLDKNPTATRSDLAAQIHAISDGTHRETHALLTDRQKALETAMQQRENNGGEGRRPKPAAAPPGASS